MAEVRTGDMLGRYLLEEPVGEGSEGRVFYALKQNAATKRGFPCVVKVAKDLDDAGRLHFLEEARNAMELGSHPNIVPVNDADEIDGVPFFVMEYQDGIDLRRFLEHEQKSRRPLPLPLVYTVLKGIADGLHHAHVAREIGRKPLALIHRDVKPANTFINKDGVTRLLDFGIATRIDANKSNRHLQGTFRYMSPEHVQGRICPAMDIYSLGVIAWEMLEGKAFRKGLTGEQILPLLLTETNTPPLQRRGLPDELVHLVESALHFDPSERPSAKEFSDALTKCPRYALAPEALAERVLAALGRPLRSRQTEHFEIPEALTKPLPKPSEPTLLNTDDAQTVRRDPRPMEDDATQHWRLADAPEPDAPSLIRKPTKPFVRPLAKPIIHQPEFAPTEKLSEHDLFAHRTQPTPSPAAHRGPTEPMDTPTALAPSEPDDHGADLVGPKRPPLWLVFAFLILAAVGSGTLVGWLLFRGGAS